MERQSGPGEKTLEREGYGARQLEADIARLMGGDDPGGRCGIGGGTIGYSALGEPIRYVKLGNGPFRWHFNGACHANEWITSLLLMRYTADYAEAGRKRRKLWGRPAEELMARTSLWIVPMLNPDGVELVRRGMDAEHPYYDRLLGWNEGSCRFHRWKANARGVDLNDQFPAGWEEERLRRGVTKPGPRDYGGEAPLCEPEAAALAAFTERNDFQAVLSLHTQGEEIYWNYRDEEPPESERWVRRLAEASGYRAVKLTDSDAGYKDWFISRFRRPGFTVEAGWGQNPLPLDRLDDIYDEIGRLLTAALDLAPPHREQT